VDATGEILDAFKRRRLAADQAQNDALVLDEAERLEITSPPRVVLQQEVIDPGSAEKPLRNRFITAGGEIAPPEIAAAHVAAEDDLGRCVRDGVVETLDVDVQQMPGLLAGILDLLADRRIA